MGAVRTRWARGCAEAIVRYFPLVFFAVLTAQLSSFATFPRQELECEETAAYLNDCCAGFDAKAQLRCEFIEGEGCGESTYPDLSVEQSECIRAMSCAEVRERGLCEVRGAYDSDGRWVSGFDDGVLCR
jgi:hypothetical protein